MNTFRNLAFKTLVASFILLVTLTPSQAAPTLRCEIRQGGQTQVVATGPTTEPYAVKPIPVGKSFQFKAVVFGSDRHIDYVKLYTYARTDRGAVLLHLGKYLLPVVPSASPGPFALTGQVYVYASPLGREINYGCTLSGDPI